MGKLFVDLVIEIQAPAQAVWEALTLSKNTDQWAPLFSSGGAKFQLESHWELGNSVLWKSEDGSVVVEGTVTINDPFHVLRFTVFDTKSTRPEVDEEDGITYKLFEKDGITTLRVLQGDFSTIPDGKGQQYRDMSTKIWQKVLPIVKALAEKDQVQG